MVCKCVIIIVWSRKFGFYIFLVILKDLVDICDSFIYCVEVRVFFS